MVSRSRVLSLLTPMVVLTAVLAGAAPTTSGGATSAGADYVAAAAQSADARDWERAAKQ